MTVAAIPPKQWASLSRRSFQVARNESYNSSFRYLIDQVPVDKIKDYLTEVFLPGAHSAGQIQNVAESHHLEEQACLHTAISTAAVENDFLVF